ncbi:hypothetical protein ACLOJK_037015 [Asimina triloba]
MEREGDGCERGRESTREGYREGQRRREREGKGEGRIGSGSEREGEGEGKREKGREQAVPDGEREETARPVEGAGPEREDPTSCVGFLPKGAGSERQPTTGATEAENVRGRAELVRETGARMARPSFLTDRTASLCPSRGASFPWQSCQSKYRRRHHRSSTDLKSRALRTD